MIQICDSLTLLSFLYKLDVFEASVNDVVVIVWKQHFGSFNFQQINFFAFEEGRAPIFSIDGRLIDLSYFEQYVKQMFYLPLSDWNWYHDLTSRTCVYPHLSRAQSESEFWSFYRTLQFISHALERASIPHFLWSTFYSL